MKITDHLDTIEKLVLDRVSPAEIRGHIQAIREQLEAYQKEAEQAPDYKKQIADLQAENTKLKAKPKAAIQVIKRRSPFDKLGTTLAMTMPPNKSPDPTGIVAYFYAHKIQVL